MSKADKSVIAYSEKIYFFTSEEYDIYFFTAANRGYFDKFRALFLPEKIWNASFMSGITLRMYARQIKQLTSHVDVIFELT